MEVKEYRPAEGWNRHHEISARQAVIVDVVGMAVIAVCIVVGGLL